MRSAVTLSFLALGATLCAASLEIFLIPNNLIDGGTIGLAMIIAGLTNNAALPLILILLNLPFFYLAWSMLGFRFLLRMAAASFCFAIALFFIHNVQPYHGDLLEVVVFGGALLGLGAGLIIRHGGCVDGSEVLAILINKKLGYTVGQVIFAFNIVIFCFAGVIHQDLQSAIRSLMTYIVAYKVIDAVIVGFDETKSVIIISSKSDKIADVLLNKLLIGHTVLYGRGGFSKKNQELLYVIIQRLRLVEMKAAVLEVDPNAFLAIEDIHEIVRGRTIGNS